MTKKDTSGNHFERLSQYDKLVADRDYWQTRAETLERAMRNCENYACYFCKHYGDESLIASCGNCIASYFTAGERIDWQFDEARFANEAASSDERSD